MKGLENRQNISLGSLEEKLLYNCMLVCSPVHHSIENKSTKIAYALILNVCQDLVFDKFDIKCNYIKVLSPFVKSF